MSISSRRQTHALSLASLVGGFWRTAPSMDSCVACLCLSGVRNRESTGKEEKWVMLRGLAGQTLTKTQALNTNWSI